jgi:hypothetical protein
MTPVRQLCLDIGYGLKPAQNSASGNRFARFSLNNG